MKADLDDAIGGAQRGLDVAVREDAVVGTVRRNRLVDSRSVRILRALGIDDGRAGRRVGNGPQ